VTYPKETPRKRAVVFQQRNFGLKLGHSIAAHLQGKGFNLVAVAIKGQTTKFTREQTEVNYEQTIDFDRVIDDPYSVPGVGDISLAEVCEQLRIDSIWPIAQERMYARNYNDRFYYSFKQNRSDEDIATYVKAAYLTYKRLFEEFKPDVIVGVNFVATFQIVALLLARRMGIPMIGIEPSKVRGLHIFSHDHLTESGPFVDRIRELQSGNGDSVNIDQARKYIRDFRKEFAAPLVFDRAFKPESRIRKIKNELRPYREIWNFIRDRPKNDHPNVGATIDYRTPRIILRDHYRFRRQRRDVLTYAYSAVPEDRPFAYMPLQVQPEHAIDVLSPYFSNQIEVARLVAQSLPGDLPLVVKDHPGMVGRRPVSYYEKLDRTVNIKLVDPMIRSDRMLKSAAIMIASGGTTVVEAAMLKLATIQLGQMGVTKLLPNVISHTDMTTLTPVIVEHLNLNCDDQTYETALEQWIAAAYDTGFEIDYEEAIWGENVQRVCEAYFEEVQRVINA